MAKEWIQKAIKRKGALRKKLGAKNNIPVSKIKKAAKGKGRTAKQARLALTLRKLKKK